MAKSKRKKQRQKRDRSRPASRRIPEPLFDALTEADRLDRQGKWVEARELLEDLNRSYPDRAEVLTALVNVYYELDDITSYQHACERLIRHRPDDPDVNLMLAGACLTNVRPALALGNFRRFLRRWPDDARADEVRKTVAFLEDQMEELLQDLGLCGEEGLQLAALHEEVLCYLEQGEFDQARQTAEQLLKQNPSFSPAINNLGEAHFREGRTEEAIAAARRVLQRAPDNFHALGNLARYLCLSGRAEEAQAWAQRLKSVESKSCDVWVKKAETFTCLGDHEEVLRVLARERGFGVLGRLDEVREVLVHVLGVVCVVCRHAVQHAVGVVQSDVKQGTTHQRRQPRHWLGRAALAIERVQRLVQRPLNERMPYFDGMAAFLVFRPRPRQTNTEFLQRVVPRFV